MKEICYKEYYTNDKLSRMKFICGTKSFYAEMYQNVGTDEKTLPDMTSITDVSDYKVSGDFDEISRHLAFWVSKVCGKHTMMFISEYCSFGWNTIYELITRHLDPVSKLMVVFIPYDIGQDILWQAIHNHDGAWHDRISVGRNINDELNFIKLSYDSIKHGRIKY